MRSALRAGAGRRSGLLLAGALALSACVQITYAAYDGTPEQWSPFERKVHYRVDRAYYNDPPFCVVVTPSARAVDPVIAALVEAALARHLSQKVPRVVGPRMRDRFARQNAFDLDDGEDRRRFARQANCPAYLTWRLLHRGDDYAIVWAQRRIGLTLRLTRARDDTPLWRASHTALRWDGGLPLSPLSAAFAAAEAARLHQDQDVLPSLIDDVLRRMFVTLPELH